MACSKDKAFESLKAFLAKDVEVHTIIKICDLYPVGTSWRKWTDHLGNFIQAHNNKKVVSFTHDPLGQEEIIITDIYFKAHPSKLSKISKWAFISFGKGKSDNFDTLYIWFLGHDDRLRFSMFYNQKWIKNEPPLISGIDTLRPIIRNLNVKTYRQADILYIKGPVATNITKSWATTWPPSKELIAEMCNINQPLTDIVLNIANMES